MQAIKEIDAQLRVFEEHESEVRSYIRSFPTTFVKAKGHTLWDIEGKEYLDFFAGAGALNYGHNHPKMKEKLLAYIAEDGISHSLDMATGAKRTFLERFHDVILKPRKLEYKVMFPGPTGTNTVEAALKLARKVTGRDLVISFTNAFHGMTLGSLSITGNAFKRDGAGIPLHNSVSMPFDNYLGEGMDTVDYLERFLEDNGSGVALPAAIILETLQGEGGLNVANYEWLKRIEEVCRRWDILLIIDDVQVGCGRTGPFFSFEPAGITPDIVCLSKSISGYGIPMALTLIKPEYDIWSPGEHNGTFRGHNLAFITATEALSFWETDAFRLDIEEKGKRVEQFLLQLVEHYPVIQGEVRGRGLMRGVACGVDGAAEKICSEAFKRGLIMETSGPNSEVFKIMPPLTIDPDALIKGFAIIEESVKAYLQSGHQV
ncbi:diaminobutyrate--2-oxoglutarate transaminase [Ammoniphilus sp. CFH 90114]|uniref:diaminobutyrate--2-oxoglutarate transaminase n=1 Tax=Ammoniphilus sp. CFH 90114 TaxID=2493665 RepID=UPI00100F5476|nr:diaminobutyrate--2-oxoglutarate transaminase [Ammoniphilus sp. CFH 90114]RXT04922.1 diaminobutyrate--2-oxoglutarate transaminase [Ammoniphilus sp. CFH 90114]